MQPNFHPLLQHRLLPAPAGTAPSVSLTRVCLDGLSPPLPLWSSTLPTLGSAGTEGETLKSSEEQP